MDIQTVLTILGSVFATFFGKEAWTYYAKKRQIASDGEVKKLEIQSDEGVRKLEIKSELKCQEKIRALEDEMAREKLKTSQIITGVDMMLTMLETEFGGDIKYQGVIDKVRTYINTDSET